MGAGVPTVEMLKFWVLEPRPLRAICSTTASVLCSSRSMARAGE